MDYSSTIHDAEDPAGDSPWGNSPVSSPSRNNIAAFNPVSADNPPPPFRFNTQSSNGLSQEQSTPQTEEFPRPGTATTASGTEDDTEASGTLHPSEAQSQSTAAEPSAEDAERATVQGQQYDQAGPPASQPEHEQPPQKPAGPQYRLQAKITGLERTGKKDPILRFDVHTNIPRFRTTQFRDVRRLHSEFVKLADHLISANPEVFVPAVPPPLTSAGAGTDEDEIRVKALMQRWLNYVCSNEVLMRDDEMVLFVESDFGYSPMVKKKQPATGVRRKILKQFAPPPDDTPELADARPTVKLFYLGSMDAGLDQPSSLQ